MPRRARDHRARFAATCAAAAALAFGSAHAAPPMPPDEVRAERVIHGEPPLWRRALALPDDALLVAAWPLKQALFWAEANHLNARIGDFLCAPFRRRGGGEP